jgi:hypothetical protein
MSPPLVGIGETADRYRDLPEPLVDGVQDVNEPTAAGNLYEIDRSIPGVQHLLELELIEHAGLKFGDPPLPGF